MDLLAMIASLLGSLFGTTATPTPTPAVLAEQQSAYEIRYFQAKPNQTLQLKTNYDEQKSAREIIDASGCSAGANGGFYTETRQPIGWVVRDSREINRSQKNQLFNGFLSRDGEGKTEISYAKPVKAVVSGLQSGPVVLYDGKAVTLKLARDKQARRVLAAVTQSGDVVFLTYFKANSILDGPTLSELPQLIADFEQQHKLDIVTAINLDGGSASAFYTKDFQLDEWQAIGSWWCLK